MVLLGGLLTDYNFKQHVASDIGIDELYVLASSLTTQQNIETISNWTTDNMMKLNEQKSNYMIFSRSNTEFTTRITMNGKTMNRTEEVKLLGVWVTTFLDREKNTREMCKKAYLRMTMLTNILIS